MRKDDFDESIAGQAAAAAGAAAATVGKMFGMFAKHEEKGTAKADDETLQKKKFKKDKMISTKERVKEAFHKELSADEMFKAQLSWAETACALRPTSVRRVLERAKGLLETANLEACVRECEYGIWTQRRGATTAVLAAALKLVLADALRAEADSSSLARVLSLYEEVKPVVAECVKQKRQAEFGVVQNELTSLLQKVSGARKLLAEAKVGREELYTAYLSKQAADHSEREKLKKEALRLQRRGKDVRKEAAEVYARLNVVRTKYAAELQAVTALRSEDLASVAKLLTSTLASPPPSAEVKYRDIPKLVEMLPVRVVQEAIQKLPRTQTIMWPQPSGQAEGERARWVLMNAMMGGLALARPREAREIAAARQVREQLQGVLEAARRDSVAPDATEPQLMDGIVRGLLVGLTHEDDPMLAALSQCVSTTHRRLVARARMVKTVLKIAEKGGSMLDGLGSLSLGLLRGQGKLLPETDAKEFKDVLADSASRLRHMSWDDLTGRKEQRKHELKDSERIAVAEYCSGAEWESSAAFVAGGFFSKDAKKLKPLSAWLNALREAVRMVDECDAQASGVKSFDEAVTKFVAKIRYPKPDKKEEKKMNNNAFWTRLARDNPLLGRGEPNEDNALVFVEHFWPATWDDTTGEWQSASGETEYWFSAQMVGRSDVAGMQELTSFEAYKGLLVDDGVWAMHRALATCAAKEVVEFLFDQPLIGQGAQTEEADSDTKRWLARHPLDSRFVHVTTSASCEACSGKRGAVHECSGSTCFGFLIRKVQAQLSELQRLQGHLAILSKLGDLTQRHSLAALKNFVFGEDKPEEEESSEVKFETKADQRSWAGELVQASAKTLRDMLSSNGPMVLEQVVNGIPVLTAATFPSKYRFHRSRGQDLFALPDAALDLARLGAAILAGQLRREQHVVEQNLQNCTETVAVFLRHGASSVATCADLDLLGRLIEELGSPPSQRAAVDRDIAQSVLSAMHSTFEQVLETFEDGWSATCSLAGGDGCCASCRMHNLLAWSLHGMAHVSTTDPTHTNQHVAKLRLDAMERAAALELVAQARGCAFEWIPDRLSDTTYRIALSLRREDVTVRWSGPELPMVEHGWLEKVEPTDEPGALRLTVQPSKLGVRATQNLELRLRVNHASAETGASETANQRIRLPLHKGARAGAQAPPEGYRWGADGRAERAARVEDYVRGYGLALGGG
eukprot:CAMPEP_0177733912 /NCGR_PEP_ID=MMETSP0484_2-20121128/23942_1 /TAXON_ID=354590 /ORGANISM="Rhodomonas lens, Strain RHODO" /LENGTH=1197 /DNA_ID=CAMNT_0019247333 /DNA_START=36 /DNA_END=3625 /DNA_ORIENTATION=-